MSKFNGASPLLADYIKYAEETTQKSVSIRPYENELYSERFHAEILIGPSYPDIEIRYCPIREAKNPSVETLIAHELTHALTIYSNGFLKPCAPPEVSTYNVQTAADIVDLIDDVIVDILIHRRGFNITTPELLGSIKNNLQVINQAKSITDVNPYESDPIRAEIKFVKAYIYCWALQKYLRLDSDTRSIFKAFTNRIPQILKKPFEKAKVIKKSFIANDIFSVEGRNRIVIDALSLWPIDERIYLSQISPPTSQILT
jgi:hypothetical protein